MTPRTMTARVRGGQLEIAIKKYVELCGISGFAVHRPVNYAANGQDERDWTVSHVDTGLAVRKGEKTIREAVAQAEKTLIQSGWSTPERFAKLIDRKAAPLRGVGVTHE